MGFSTLVCTYIYGTFEIIVGAIESYQHAARTMLERIESIAQATLNFYTYTIEKTLQTLISAIKTYQKIAVDMIYNPSSEEALGHSIWCSRLWDCLTFVNQLLDPNSLLFKQFDKWFSTSCHKAINGPLLNSIQALLSDFNTFQQTVCAYGFTFEFGISIIKKVLQQYKKLLIEFIDTLSKKIRLLKFQCNSYLDWIIDTGIIDYLAKLEGLFNCVIDSSETCSAIATASNYYEDACYKLRIQKGGDTWSMDTSFKNNVYGSLEEKVIEISNLKYETDRICEILVNPQEAKRAAKAYNLSKNVFPGGIKWSDVTNENGNLSWSKLASKKTWKKHKIYKYTTIRLKEIMDAYRSGKSAEEQANITTEKMLNGLEIDAEGNIYYRTGCTLELIKTADTDIMEEYYSDESGSNEVLLNNDEILSVTQAAVQISKNPNSELSKHCEKIWKRINEWSKNTNIAKKY